MNKIDADLIGPWACTILLNLIISFIVVAICCPVSTVVGFLILFPVWFIPSGVICFLFSAHEIMANDNHYTKKDAWQITLFSLFWPIGIMVLLACGVIRACKPVGRLLQKLGFEYENAK